MDTHVIEYYRQYSEKTSKGLFHKVIALHETPEIEWKAVSKLIPKLPKGWYELAHLPIEDRLEFTREFWLSKLPYHPIFPEFLIKFFNSLDDIGIFVFQRKFEDPYDVHMVYSLSGNSGFFHGNPPSSDEEIATVQKHFPDYILPDDYVAFMKIHNGFSKSTDTGILPLNQLWDRYLQFQRFFQRGESLFTTNGVPVDPKTVIPFYESFGMPFFQCFWAEWYPAQEMGNVYYSDVTKTISDHTGVDVSTESMAFPTFLDWLMFYLEKIG